MSPLRLRMRLPPPSSPSSRSTEPSPATSPIWPPSLDFTRTLLVIQELSLGWATNRIQHNLKQLPSNRRTCLFYKGIRGPFEDLGQITCTDNGGVSLPIGGGSMVTTKHVVQLGTVFFPMPRISMETSHRTKAP